MLARCSARVLTRNAIGTVRTVATSSNSYGYPARNVVAAGLVGYLLGVTSVGVAGYGIYYYSNIKKFVDTLTPTLQLLNESNKALMDDKPAPNIALQYLRKAAKAYLAYFPGSGIIIDLTFNRLDAIVDQHAEQATEYVKHAYSQFQRVVQHGKNKHESHTALEVLALCKRLAEDLGTLGGVNIPIGNIIERAAAPIGAVVGGIFADLQGKFKNSIDQLTGKAPSQDATRGKTLIPPNSEKDAQSPNKEE